MAVSFFDLFFYHMEGSYLSVLLERIGVCLWVFDFFITFAVRMEWIMDFHSGGNAANRISDSCLCRTDSIVYRRERAARYSRERTKIPGFLFDRGIFGELCKLMGAQCCE